MSLQPVLCSLVTVVLAVSAAAGARGQTIDIKGVPMGGPESAVREQFRSANCITPRDTTAADRACFVRGTTYGGVPADLSFFLYKDQIHSVLVAIKPGDYAELVSAMSQRFSAPVRRAEEAQTRGGIKVENETATWHVADVEITAEKYSSRITEGRVRFRSAGSSDEFQRRKGDRQQERAKDL